MFKLITIAVAMIACVAAAPGLASLGHGPILSGYGSPLALSAPISYAAPITKIAAPAYAPLGGHIGLGYGGLIGAPIAKYGAPLALSAPLGLGLGAHGLGLGAHGLGLGAHGLGLGAHGLGLGAHGLGAPIW